MNKKNELKHSPTPWIAVKIPGGKSCAIDDQRTNEYVATAWGTEHDAEANAAFIVQACNAHEALEDALLAALPFVEDAIEECFKAHHVELIVKKIRAALKLAE